MQIMPRQRSPWRRALLALSAIMFIVPTLLLNFAFFAPGIAQAHRSSPHISPRMRVVVKSNVKHDVSPPLRSIKPVHNAVAKSYPALPLPKIRQGAPNGIRDHIQNKTTINTMPSPSNSLDGVGQGFVGPQGTFSVSSAPSDSNGTVGLQDYIDIVNTDFAIFNKDPSRGPVGTVRYGPVQINTLWSGFGGLCQTDNDGDPTVVYDSIANRWVISQFAVTNPNPNFYQCVAVSTGSDPTGTYNRYSFSYTTFPDYPKMGLWPDAYYTTYNMFNAAGTTFLGGEACAFDRASMLNGAAATQQCFSAGSNYGGLLPSQLDGATQPPAGSPNYVLALDTTTSLALWKFHVDWANPSNSTFTGPTSIPVASYAQACGGGTCIPQSGTTNQLDSLADRLMYRLEYRNFGSYESLVVDHSVTAGSSVGMRWYEIRSPGGTPSVFQSGTYAPGSNYRWMGSISQDKSGDMAMGFSVSSSSMHPAISYAGRLVTDSPGTMGQGEASLIAGGGSQTGSLTRWGDYSSIAVDPSDDCTFWYTDQYIPSNGSFNWKTHIGSFKFPSCGSGGSADFTISANPTSLSIAQGSSGTSTIGTTQVGNPGTVSLSDQVSPSGPTASQNPTSVQAGQSSTLTVTVGSSVPTGTYTVTITGTEGSNTHSTTVTVTVTAPSGGDFTISANPTSLSIAQGSSGTSTIGTTQVGNPGAVSLSDQVSPSGPTASQNPTSVQAGQSSTLTVTVGSSVPTGTYTVTITGTEGSNTHSTTVTVTVTPSGGGGGIVNGGFETGDFTGWSTTGTTSISNVSHSGSYSGEAGSSNPTNGDSTISQTFTDPSGSSSLAFWYEVVCPDTVQYDWATATLKDNTTGTTSTILPDTCNNNGVWVQVTASVTSGDSYTLTLINHDDNYPGDPTYTLFDDVATAGAGDFTISANPTSLSIAQGSSGTSTIGTTQVGNPGAVSLSDQVSPSGPTASQNPTSVQAGQSSTLTVTVGSSVPTGTYTVTITGTEGSNTHSTTVTVTVTPSGGGGGIVNGGFETGSFSGWSTTGTTSISNVSHSGSYSGEAGSSNPSNGNSTIYQTFKAPSGVSKLTFWYEVVCLDSVRYDWATATLKDNTSGTTKTILPRTCNNNVVWVQVTASVTAGHSYTLTLINHDDNYPGDPTFTRFDDVNVS